MRSLPASMGGTSAAFGDPHVHVSTSEVGYSSRTLFSWVTLPSPLLGELWGKRGSPSTPARVKSQPRLSGWQWRRGGSLLQKNAGGSLGKCQSRGTGRGGVWGEHWAGPLLFPSPHS